MTRFLTLAAATAAATFVAMAPASAQHWRWNENGWRTIGYTRVDGRDSDRINLPGVTRQRAIRLCAMNQPLRRGRSHGDERGCCRGDSESEEAGHTSTPAVSPNNGGDRYLVALPADGSGSLRRL